MFVFAFLVLKRKLDHAQLSTYLIKQNALVAADYALRTPRASRRPDSWSRKACGPRQHAGVCASRNLMIQCPKHHTEAHRQLNLTQPHESVLHWPKRPRARSAANSNIETCSRLTATHRPPIGLSISGCAVLVEDEPIHGPVSTLRLAS